MLKHIGSTFGAFKLDNDLLNTYLDHPRRDSFTTMPLPDEAITLTGGCSCGVIRYRIVIPEISSRPSTPFAPREAGMSVPYTTACHCNDCRRATASCLPLGCLQVPGPMISVSIMGRSGPDSNIVSGRILDVMDEKYDAVQADAERPDYQPAVDVFRAQKAEESGKTWLRFFHSFDCGMNFSRSFCGRCGTPVCFHIGLKPEWCDGRKLPDGWSDIFDIYTGSVDRVFLDKDWLFPQSEVNFQHGTLFSKTVSATAKYLKHLPKAQAFSEKEDKASENELAKLAK